MTLHEQLKHMQRHQELMALELKRQNKVMGLLFVIVAVMVLVVLLLVAFNGYLVTELGDLRGQLADHAARVTALTAEVRGIGG